MGDVGTADQWQEQAVQANDRLVSIVAAPGTGKTWVLAERMARQIGCGADPGRIAVMTFTRRAARQLERRLREHPRCRELAPRIASPKERWTRGIDEEPVLWVGTVHEIAWRVLRLHPQWTGRGRNAHVASPEETFQRMQQAMRETGMLPVEAEPSRVRSLVEKCVQGMHKRKMRCEDLRGTGADPSDWGLAHAAYDERLAREEVFDLSDLVRCTVELLEGEPHAGRAWGRRFDEIMVDEYQDNDPLMVRLLGALAHEARIVVAGDQDQSIYGWRGAIGTLSRMEGLEATHGDARRIELHRDYRLPGEIQQAANHLRRRMQDPGHEPAPARAGGWTRPMWIATKPDNGDRVLVEVVGRLSVVQGGNPDGVGEARSSTPGDCVVVARTHAQCLEAAQALSGAGYTVTMSAGHGIGDACETLAAWLQAAAWPTQDAGLARALGAFPYQVTERKVSRMRMRARGRGTTLGEMLVQLQQEEGSEGLKLALGTGLDVLGMWRSARALAGEGQAQALVTSIAQGLRLEEHAASQGEQAHQEWTRTEALAKDLASKGADTVRLAEALGSHDEQEELQEEGGDVVEVRTMHSVKGLEYRHVVAVGWAQGDFPSGWARNLEEERRLAFMVVTRAKRTFIALVPSEDHQAQARAPSQFLLEAGIREGSLQEVTRSGYGSMQ